MVNCFIEVSKYRGEDDNVYGVRKFEDMERIVANQLKTMFNNSQVVL